MARTKNSAKIKEEKPLEEQPEVKVPETKGGSETKVDKSKVVEPVIPTNVERLMKLYPQYKEFYVTRQGFVHPVGASKSMLNGATLYKNKYYNK